MGKTIEIRCPKQLQKAPLAVLLNRLLVSDPYSFFAFWSDA